MRRVSGHLPFAAGVCLLRSRDSRELAARTADGADGTGRPVSLGGGDTGGGAYRSDTEGES